MTKSSKALSFCSPTGAVQQTNKTTNVPHYCENSMTKSSKALSFCSPTGAVQQTNKTTNVPHYCL